MTISVVQTLSVQQSPYSGSFASNVTAGNSVVFALTAFTTAGATMSSSAPLFNGSPVTGGTLLMHNQSSTSGNNVYAAIWLLPNLAGGAKSVAVTVTNGASATAIGFTAWEVAGLGASPSLDQVSPNTGKGTTGTSLASGSTPAITAAPEFVAAVAVSFGNAITKAGAPWTEVNSAGGTDSIQAEQIVTSSGGTYSYAPVAAGSADWVSMVATIQGTSGDANVTGVAAQVTAAGGTGVATGDNVVVLRNTPQLAESAATNSPSVASTWNGTTPVIGDFLLAVVTVFASTTGALPTTPAGWTLSAVSVVESTTCRVAYYTRTASGDSGDNAPAWTATLTGTASHSDMAVTLYDFYDALNGTPALSVSGTATGTTTSPIAPVTSGNVPQAGCYGVGGICYGSGTTGVVSITTPSGWTLGGITTSTTHFGHGGTHYIQNPASGSALTCSLVHGTSTFVAAAVAVVEPVPAAIIFGTAAAVTAGGGTGTAFGQSSANVTGVAAAVTAGGGTGLNALVITGLTTAGDGSAGYFNDQLGHPRMVIGDAAWALPGNAGRWSSGDWQGDFDTYLATRGGQGYTVVYTKPIGTTQSGNIDDDGATFDSLYPFQGGSPSTGTSGANPSTGLTAAFWARIDYFLASAAVQGITVFLNAIGYNSDFQSGPGPLAGKSSTEFQAYGAALGARYGSQPNLIWHLADDYFGGSDTLISGFMTGVRGAGDTHLVSIENYPETDSRQDFSDSSSLPWGASNAQYNFCYSYNVTYFGVEVAYLESSPITVIQGDGYFYQGGSTYAGGTGAFAYDRAARQDAWHALSSGARGIIQGDEAVWQWPSTAQAAVSNNWYQKNNIGPVRKYLESLPGWQALIPDTSSVLVTAGRGTHATTFSSGGGGGQYEVAFTDSYVTASRTADKSLAVIYMSHGSTITIDESEFAAAYSATWVDPVSLATSAAATGTTYNSTAKGNNSKSESDWVLVLQAVTEVDQDVAGVAAAASVAGGAGTPSGGGTAAGTAAVAPAAGGIGTPSAGVVIAGTAATVTAAGGTGIPSGSAVTAGAGAQVTAAGGIGSSSADGIIAGAGAAVTVAGGIGTASGGTTGDGEVAGVAAAVTVAGGAGIPSAGVVVAGPAAAVTAGAGTGAPQALASITGVAAAVTVAGAQGSLTASARIPGIAAAVTAAGGTGGVQGGSPGVLTATTAATATFTAATGATAALTAVTAATAVLTTTTR